MVLVLDSARALSLSLSLSLPAHFCSAPVERLDGARAGTRAPAWRGRPPAGRAKWAEKLNHHVRFARPLRAVEPESLQGWLEIHSFSLHFLISQFRLVWCKAAARLTQLSHARPGDVADRQESYCCRCCCCHRRLLLASFYCLLILAPLLLLILLLTLANSTRRLLTQAGHSGERKLAIFYQFKRRHARAMHLVERTKNIAPSRPCSSSALARRKPNALSGPGRRAAAFACAWIARRCSRSTIGHY